MIKKFFVLLLVFQATCFPVTANSACYDLLNKKVQEDIQTSYPFLKNLMKKDNAWNYDYEDLIKMGLPIGKKDSHLDSLISLFSGTYIGEKRLIITSGKYSEKWGNSFTGYIFYKEINGLNVLIKIKRGPEKWEVVEKSKVRGRYITLREINKNCGQREIGN
ncbi:hypothetical protein BGM25_17250 [Bacillus sp. FJAT-29953]|nr:hypothetical protein [Bacillus sp. FJAT-29953]